MTHEELKALPAGSIVRMDDELGEIIQAGNICHIMWASRTNIVHTDSKAWQKYITFLELE